MGNLFSSSSTSVSTPAPSSKALPTGKLHVAQGSVKGPLETEPKSAPPTAAQDNLPWAVQNAWRPEAKDLKKNGRAKMGTSPILKMMGLATTLSSTKDRSTSARGVSRSARL